MTPLTGPQEETRLVAQIKAAAWGLVALIGANRTQEMLQRLVNEIANQQWSGLDGRPVGPYCATSADWNGKYERQR